MRNRNYDVRELSASKVRACWTYTRNNLFSTRIDFSISTLSEFTRTILSIIIIIDATHRDEDP